MSALPGFTTHYLFGVKAYNDLPNNYLKHVISKYRWLYQLGLQGPDIFFYNIPILRHRDYRNVGSYMHDFHVNDFFQSCLTEISEIHSRQQKEQALSYFAGYLCHYVGDSICHPFIYGRIQYETDVKSSHFHGRHAALENDIDAILLRKFKKKKPSEFNQAATICLNGQEIQFISRFYAAPSTPPITRSASGTISRSRKAWCAAPSMRSASAGGSSRIRKGARKIKLSFLRPYF